MASSICFIAALIWFARRSTVSRSMTMYDLSLWSIMYISSVAPRKIMVVAFLPLESVRIRLPSTFISVISTSPPDAMSSTSMRKTVPPAWVIPAMLSRYAATRPILKLISPPVLWLCSRRRPNRLDRPRLAMFWWFRHRI